MKQNVWVNKAESFADAERFDSEYYENQTAERRLDTMQFLRDQYCKRNKKAGDAQRKGLRRFIKVTKLS